MRFRLAAVAGAVVVLAGLGLAFAPALAGDLGVQFTVVTILGVLATVQGVRFALARRRADRRESETADPELRYEVPTPGDDLDEALVTTTSFSKYARSRRDNLRSRLAAAAQAVLVEVEGDSPAAANDRLADGSWTDDPVAAWFLGDDLKLPTRTRLEFVVTRRPSFVIGFERTLTVVESLTELGATADNGGNDDG